MTTSDYIAQKIETRKLINTEMQAFLQRGGRIKRIPHLTAEERIWRHKQNANYYGKDRSEKKPPMDVDKLVGGVG